ncbi:hypothetical protein SGLAD_v1c05300 [Spiroplasma gladiatoris]|uniref:Uncharacterized protein n=1 Tax=Spiroplasma gladiatoris TaxID=2143 RepID=A0A4V1AQ96_9MOLU|nr:hypothetical protein [Spiroplasma gladiatoris]QBQ07729.1 hypothetical protein SGLAD_v1c05300 [Spiroplasma gladiatoris]
MYKNQIEYAINAFKNHITIISKEILVKSTRINLENKFNIITNKALIAYWKSVEIFQENEDINVTLIASKIANEIEKSSMKHQIDNFTRSYQYAGVGLDMDEICESEIIKMLNIFLISENIDLKILNFILDNL